MSTDSKSEVLQALAYFDIFNHPLTKDELLNLCDLKASQEEKVVEVLDNLISDGKCYYSDGFYSIQNTIEEQIKTRKLKEQKADAYYKRLPAFTKLISKFPYVRAIAISGSLSKGVMHDDGDIDYFIVTAKDRLWICRTLLVLFKKVFLLNSKKYFCVNYFVDENNLEIIDKNIFTAVEVTYLLPVFNAGLIHQLKEKNQWCDAFFPSFSHPIDERINQLLDNSRSKKKNGLESLFKGKRGDRFDLWLMKKTFKRWQKKFKHFDGDKFELTMRTNRGVSKHHPRDFQNKVLNEFETRLARLTK